MARWQLARLGLTAGGTGWMAAACRSDGNWLGSWVATCRPNVDRSCSDRARMKPPPAESYFLMMMMLIII